MKQRTKTIVSAEDVSGAIASETIDLKYNYGVAIQCTFTGAPSGDVLLEGSNDGSNWSEIDSGTISGTDIMAFNKDALYWPFIRVSKAAGGTGTMTVTASIKGA